MQNALNNYRGIISMLSKLSRNCIASCGFGMTTRLRARSVSKRYQSFPESQHLAEVLVALRERLPHTLGRQRPLIVTALSLPQLVPIHPRQGDAPDYPAFH